MSASLIVTFLATAAVVILVPGPDMLFCLASGLNGGSRSGLLAALGAATGEVVHIGASAFGLAALFAAAPPLFSGVRILGAAYLGLLGVRTLRARDKEVGGGRHRNGCGKNRAYWRGLVTNLLNPKMALFSIAFLPQFVEPAAGHVALQFALLGGCFLALDLAVDGAVGVLAGRLRRLLDGRRARRNFNRMAGSLYLGIAAKVALER